MELVNSENLRIVEYFSGSESHIIFPKTNNLPVRGIHYSVNSGNQHLLILFVQNAEHSRGYETGKKTSRRNSYYPEPR